MQAGETPEGMQFSVSDPEVAERLMQGGPEAQQAYEELHQRMERSLLAAFNWLTDTKEVDGDTERGVEIGNLYSYALEEGLTERDIDRILEKTTEE